MKVNEIRVDGYNGFYMKVEKSASSDRVELAIEYQGTSIVIESTFGLIEQALEEAQEYLDFYRSRLKEAK